MASFMETPSSPSFLHEMTSTLYGFCHSKTLCDTVLVVDETTAFWAHSAVLAAASYELCTQFQQNAEPLSTNFTNKFCLQLSGCDPLAVDVVLRFIYTGSLVAPVSFHNPQHMSKILDVCRSLGLPLNKLNGVPISFNQQAVETSSLEEDIHQLNHKENQGHCVVLCLEMDVSRNGIEANGVPALLESARHDNLSVTEIGTGLKSQWFASSTIPLDICDRESKVVTEVEPSEPEVCKIRNLSSKRTNVSGRLCHRCGKVISPAWNFYQHSQKCRQKKIKTKLLKSCLECGEKFSSLLPYRTHLQQVHKLVCETCRRWFHTSAELDQHRLVHTAERPYVCHTCGSSFRQPSTLLQHINAKHAAGDEKRYLCDLCGASFATSGYLRHHVDGHRRPYVCDRCQKGFRARHLLEEHMLSCQTGDARPFICNVCGVRFTKKNNLTRHSLSHGGISTCQLCGKTYRHKQSLDDHIRNRHNAESQLNAETGNRCSVCGKTFTRLKYLDKHLLLHNRSNAGHHDSGSHVCLVCGRSFSHPRFLANHSFVHQEHELLKCLQCGKTFTHKRYLTMHALIHREQQYACPVCNKQFPFVAHLMKHCSHVHAMNRTDVDRLLGSTSEQNVAS